jgi:hypothetical protein
LVELLDAPPPDDELETIGESELVGWVMPVQPDAIKAIGAAMSSFSKSRRSFADVGGVSRS